MAAVLKGDRENFSRKIVWDVHSDLSSEYPVHLEWIILLESIRQATNASIENARANLSVFDLTSYHVNPIRCHCFNRPTSTATTTIEDPRNTTVPNTLSFLLLPFLKALTWGALVAVDKILVRG